MKSTTAPRLLGSRSDERDTFRLVNALRDTANNVPHYGADLTTTSATTAELWRDQVPGDSTLILHVDVAASSAVDHAGYSRRLVVTRTGAAACVIQATDTIGTDYESAAAWDLAFSVDGGDLVLSVTGAAGIEIAWKAGITASWGQVT